MRIHNRVEGQAHAVHEWAIRDAVVTTLTVLVALLPGIAIAHAHDAESSTPFKMRTEHMTTLIRWSSVSAVAVLLLLSQAIAGAADNGVPGVRTSNARVSEVFRHAMARSASFRDLVATFEALDRTVYVEEGSCHPPELRSCLHMVRSSDAKVLVVRSHSHLDRTSSK